MKIRMSGIVIVFFSLLLSFGVRGQKIINVSEVSTLIQALRYAEQQADRSDDSLWIEIHIAPGVYWIDDPDDPTIRKASPGDWNPFGLKVRLNRTKLIGMSGNPEDVVLACNRGQTQGAVGNFTMLYIEGSNIVAENITFGNYCNVDLEYKSNPQLNRKKRADAIVQAQLILCSGDNYFAKNCRFISRLNLCPFMGADRALFENCYFECTDDALCGTGIYKSCRFTFFSSKPFYGTSPQGAYFEDCDIHSKVQGTQYLTKVSDKVTLKNCRWSSDDPNLKIEWCKTPNPKDVCLMEDCTLNGKPLIVPPTPDIPMAVGTPTLPIMANSRIAEGRWSIDAYKPSDTHEYNWRVLEQPSWAFGEGTDGAEGCFGLVQLVRGARLMYTGYSNEEYRNQTLIVKLSPCKSAGQGFGSATGQYLDLCLKFDTHTLSGYGLRFVRTPLYDRAVEVYLVQYSNGGISAISKPERCDLFKKGCMVTLKVVDSTLSATIENGDKSQTLIAEKVELNIFGGVHIQHTGTVGAAATVIESIDTSYE